VAEQRTVGGREVAIVAIVAVAVVLGAVMLTSILPVDLQRVVFHTPLLILVLVIGTAAILWRTATHRPPDG
jgi:uncharacterized membrane protein